MRGRVRLWAMAGTLAVATAHAQDTPPPRGSEHPRLQGMPGDRDNPLPSDRHDESFGARIPTPEATRVDDERQARRAAETVEVDTPALPRGQTCGDLAPDEQMTCPLDRFAKVDRLQPIPGGVRVHFARGGKMPVSRLRQVLECQAAIGASRGEEVPPCAFLGPDRRAAVAERNGRVTVDVTATDREAADVVRQEVRTALGR